MIEELKLIVDLLKGATDSALYAFLGLGVYNLVKLSIVSGSILYGLKMILSKAFKSE